MERTPAQRLVNRRAAGRMLAEFLRGYAGTDAIVLGITRGGLVVAHEVARRLKLPLDALVVHRMSEPDNPHLGVGVVTEHGHVIVSRPRLRALAPPSGWLREARDQAMTRARQRAATLRGTYERRDIADRTVILVDDSAATGTTLRAAIRAARAMGANDIIVAVPVAPRRLLEALRRRVGAVVCPTTPADLLLHGVHYPAPLQLDEEALSAFMAQDWA